MARNFDKDAWLEQKEQKLAAAKSALEEGLKRLTTSEGWREMLEAMAHLGRLSTSRLSFQNQLLVHCQRPGTTNAATFKRWQENGRMVKKGEKSLAILAPVFARKGKNEGGNTSDEGEGQKLVGFRTLPVFAEDQTDGTPLPTVTPPDVTGDEAFAGSVETLREVTLMIPGQPVSGIQLRARETGDHPTARGWYDRQTREIVVVTDGRSRAQVFSTLTHEVAHALLHPIGDPHGVAHREVEAESTAFVVCHALGLDTGEKSFNYVGAWGDGENALKLIAESGQRIAKAATTILDALTGEAVEQEEEAEAAQTRRRAAREFAVPTLLPEQYRAAALASVEAIEQGLASKT
jgi:antirestriction protein ArdC